MRQRRLEGIQAVIKRQQCVSPKGHDDRLVLDRQNGRLCLFGAGGTVGDGDALLPFSDGLLVDAVTFGERPQALLTMVYRST